MEGVHDGWDMGEYCEVDRQTTWIRKKTTHEHKGHRQDRRKHQCCRSICDSRRNEVAIRGATKCIQAQCETELHELINIICETDHEVSDRVKYEGHNHESGDISDHFGGKVRYHIVHLVCLLTEEHRSFTLECCSCHHEWHHESSNTAEEHGTNEIFEILWRRTVRVPEYCSCYQAQENWLTDSSF